MFAYLSTLSQTWHSDREMNFKHGTTWDRLKQKMLMFLTSLFEIHSQQHLSQPRLVEEILHQLIGTFTVLSLLVCITKSHVDI